MCVFCVVCVFYVVCMCVWSGGWLRLGPPPPSQTLAPLSVRDDVALIDPLRR